MARTLHARRNRRRAAAGPAAGGAAADARRQRRPSQGRGVFVRKYKDNKPPKGGGGETNSFGSYTGKINVGDTLGRYETLGMVDMGGAAAFGDNIDIDLGMLSFSHVDVSVPGNSALPVELRRELSRSTPTSGRIGMGN